MHFYLLDHEATIDDLKKFNFSNQKIGVIVYIENSKGEILLQQRGEKSRDENGLFECLGGKVEQEDKDFKSAIIREIKEEAGDEFDFELSNSLGIFHCFKNDINWLFIIYHAKYMAGNIKVMEPMKCRGYHFFKCEEAIKSEVVTDSCKYLIKTINDYHLNK